jgi:hypothetical protein
MNAFAMVLRAQSKRTTAALVALIFAAVVWVLAGLFIFNFVWPHYVDGRYWNMIDPVSPEKAASMRRDAVTMLMVVIAIALAHLAIAFLHRKTSWGRWLTMTAGTLYLVGAFRLMFETLHNAHDAGALPVYAVGAILLSFLMLNGSRKSD